MVQIALESRPKAHTQYKKWVIIHDPNISNPKPSFSPFALFALFFFVLFLTELRVLCWQNEFTRCSILKASQTLLFCYTHFVYWFSLSLSLKYISIYLFVCVLYMKTNGCLLFWSFRWCRSDYGTFCVYGCLLFYIESTIFHDIFNSNTYKVTTYM